MKFTAAGLAMLVQVRVTELPSSTGPEGSTDTEVFLGGSERKIMFLVSIASKDFFFTCLGMHIQPFRKYIN